jgi:ATP-dependent DNA helicase RecQ
MKDILFFDLEVDSQSHIQDIGAWYNHIHFHDSSVKNFHHFLKSKAPGAYYACGHNIINHDIPILKKYHLDEDFFKKHFIDTLYLSALLFPQQPYHKLVKDYKLVSEEPNNPVSDSKLTMRLLKDIIRQFNRLDTLFKTIYFHLLKDIDNFRGFFIYLNEKGLLELMRASREEFLPGWIKDRFNGKLCTNSDFKNLIKNYPLELAYALALFNSDSVGAISPPWLVHRHPGVLQVFHQLRYHRCQQAGCTYCHIQLDARAGLKRIFGFENFRRFEGDREIPLQEQAVNAALDNKSFLAIFPTGSGKSITFQLPALMKGEACRGLTVVISPLQSLMKDQVDILKNRHERIDAVTINGLLSPLERAEAIEKVESGTAHILYISPESLRSPTILKIIKERIIDRFVIDEAHCFSSWGQDFRVDYQYIGEFLVRLIKEKALTRPIPVSCFTATAKPPVIEDIKDYFQKKTGIELEVFKTTPKRKNLTYGVYYAASSREKFSLLLNLLSQDENPKIVYTTRVKRSEDLAERLRQNGFNAAAYNGRMTSEAKIKIQNDFMAGNINIIVATSAFGMGIDKDDVSMVIHYNISDSLENYIQEAGRAGRSEHIKANCYVLFDDSDLMGHFSLLNATRINKKEIYQVWQGIKKIRRQGFSRSALELARAAGWDTELLGWETRVKTALAALEDSGFIKRGLNQTRIFATSLLVKNMAEASALLQNYEKFDENDRLHATRIIKFIISHQSCAVDYIADILGIGKNDTRRLINELKGLRIIGDDRDLTAFVNISPGSKSNSIKILEKFSGLETRLLQLIKGDTRVLLKKISLKELNHTLRENNIESDIESLRTVLMIWKVRGLIGKNRLDRQNHIYEIQFKKAFPEIQAAVTGRLELARRILKLLFINAGTLNDSEDSADTLVEFSINELKKYVESHHLFKKTYSLTDYDKTLLYLNEIYAIKLDRGLFVFYTPYAITRCDMDNKRQYTNKEYRKFENFYLRRIEQIHIVGEYTKKLSRNYQEAMVFVDDYFNLEYPVFIKKYFPRRMSQIQKPITEQQFKELFKDLSPTQLKIINDNQSRAILVAAGPGSGKTRVLVHKVASLLTLEDVRTEQFLMLTFSRAAALEMKERLRGLIKQTANYIDIYTFHSFAFTIAEIKGDLEQSGSIIPRATEMIESGSAAHKVENKSVLVIDEFQDIGADEFALIQSIINAAKEIRVVAVGDDDQNIFEFRGSSLQYMRTFKKTFQAKIYHLNTNYRGKNNLVQFSNLFIKKLTDRVKAGQDLVSSEPGFNGKITITKYKSSPLITPLVNDVIRQQGPGTVGNNCTTAVLTTTNEEALQVYSLLRQNGCSAKLLVSYSGFSLKCLVELKLFSHLIKEITQKSEDKIIEREKWLAAQKQMMENFSRSKQLDLASTIIDSFEKQYTNLLEIDWSEYLDEINLEDFIYPDKDTIFVSTMHKAKGKEFDRVFLLLDNYKIVKDENIRVIYVAITRAKENLLIHTNSDVFERIWVPGQCRFVDDAVYTEPEWLSFQLTHRDVYLDYFTNESVAKTIESLQAGDGLEPAKDDPTLLTASNKRVLRLSASAAEKVQKFLNKGYEIISIHAEYIVVWKRKEDDKQYRVVLPLIKLQKTNPKLNHG